MHLNLSANFSDVHHQTAIWRCHLICYILALFSTWFINRRYSLWQWLPEASNKHLSGSLKSGADLQLYDPRPDSSRSGRTVHRMACLFTSKLTPLPNYAAWQWYDMIWYLFICSWHNTFNEAKQWQYRKIEITWANRVGKVARRHL